MAVDSRAKGARGEYQARDLLRKYTDYQWERVPASGALSYLKGDLYVPNEDNKYMIEVKNYEEPIFDHKVFTNKSSPFTKFWQKAVEQAGERDQHPVLVFKHNRSKFFVAVDREPKSVNRFMFIKWLDVYVLMFEEWLQKEEIEWLKNSAN
jgi:hypothetical protein